MTAGGDQQAQYYYYHGARQRNKTKNKEAELQVARDRIDQARIRKRQIRKLFEVLVIVISCLTLINFLIFIFCWVKVVHVDSILLGSFFGAMQKVTVIISISLYMTLVAFVIGGLCGVIGAAKKNHTAVFVSAICHIEIFLGELEFGLIGAVLTNNRIDQAVFAYQEIHIETFVENPFNESQQAANVLWTAMQIQFQCCGTKDRSDWRNNNKVFLKSKKNVAQMFPISCCRDWFTLNDVTDFKHGNVLTERCIQNIKTHSETHVPSGDKRVRRSVTATSMSTDSPNTTTVGPATGSTTPSIISSGGSSSIPGLSPQQPKQHVGDVCRRKYYTPGEINQHFFLRGCKEHFFKWYEEQIEPTFRVIFVLAFVHLVAFVPSIVLFILYDKLHGEDDEDYI